MPAKFSKTEKPRTKAQTVAEIAEATELPKSDVALVLETLSDLILNDLKKGGVGTAALPGLIKIDIVAQKATKAREGRNPATGEPITIAAKRAKARGKVRVRALKTLKDVL